MKITAVIATGPLPVPHIESGGFTTTAEIVVRWRQDGRKCRHVVPVDFTHDGPSVPGFARSFLPWHPSLFRAAGFHDNAYQRGNLKRRVADRLFREIIRIDQRRQVLIPYDESTCFKRQLAKIRRHLRLFKAWRKRTRAWVGVRLFGWLAYRKHRRVR